MRADPGPSKHKQPKIFVGSSTEGLTIARALQSELEQEYDVEIWNQSEIFGLGTVTIEALENAVLLYDFGLFVFTPDDEIKSRDSTKPAARDNVIFEAGLFIGKIGRHRSFVIRPRGICHADAKRPPRINGR
jgi:predicted nucleotide-binding protein